MSLDQTNASPWAAKTMSNAGATTRNLQVKAACARNDLLYELDCLVCAHACSQKLLPDQTCHLPPNVPGQPNTKQHLRKTESEHPNPQALCCAMCHANWQATCECICSTTLGGIRCPMQIGERCCTEYVQPSLKRSYCAHNCNVDER